MKCELIIIGDEILSGRTQEANARWLARWAKQKGLKISQVTIIADDKEAIWQALATATKEGNKAIITSGGIGPTLDDITKESIGAFFSKKLIPNSNAIPIVAQNYQRMGRSWTPESNSYHLVPEDFTVTDNPRGLAPGLVYFDETKKIMVMSAPGVPHEFQTMVSDIFYPKIMDTLTPDSKSLYSVSIRTYGVPEEKIFFEICPNLWTELEEFGKVASLPHLMGVDIVVSLKNHLDYQNTLEKIKNIIAQTPLSPNVWQYGDLELEELILKEAREKNLTIAFAESCTGGLSSSRITDIAGSSDVFLGGVVSYANELKENFLGVKIETLKQFGAVSEETAREMAQGLIEKTSADIAVSWTGIAGPDGGSDLKPVGTVAIAVATKKHISSNIYLFKGDREKLKRRFSERGLLDLFLLMTH